MWCASQFETIGFIAKYKTTRRRVLISVELLKTTFLQKCFLHFVIRLIVPNRKTCYIFMENADKCYRAALVVHTCQYTHQCYKASFSVHQFM